MKGILFKPKMIKAIVEGRKTVTRRVIKLACELDNAYDRKWVTFSKRDDWCLYKGRSRITGALESFVLKPYYQVGEVVYIKEAWSPIAYFIGTGGVRVEYKLDSELKDIPCKKEGYDKYFKSGHLDFDWEPPLFMPAWAARYFIEIKNVRAERLQEITLGDAIQEGVTRLDPNWHTTALDDFMYPWDSINKDYPWESNPWVWRYEFQLHKGG